MLLVKVTCSWVVSTEYDFLSFDCFIIDYTEDLLKKHLHLTT